MYTVKSIPNDTLFLVPRAGRGLTIYVKKKIAGREVLCCVYKARSGANHTLYVRRLRSHEVPSGAASASPIPTETIFQSEPQLVFDDR